MSAVASSATVRDVLIVGGGPAGLATALGLARQLYTAIVFDSKQYRNHVAERMHNVPTWDHRPPQEFRSAAQRGILERYDTITFRESRIEAVVKRKDGLFEAVDSARETFVGRKVVIASGVSDIMPDIQGFRELWGKSIFHCLFCHGFEERGGASAGILAQDFLADLKFVLHVAGMVAPLAKDTVIYSNGDESITKRLLDVVEGKRLTIEPRKIVSIERSEVGDTDVTVRFIDGSQREERFLVAVPNTKLNGSFIQQLGLEVSEQGFVKTTPPFNETSVAGVYAVGDCATLIKSVTQAMAAGSMAAGGIVGQLGQQRLVL